MDTGVRGSTQDGPVELGLHLWVQGTTWPEVRQAALRAEAAGYRYVWTWDHLYAIFGDPGQAELEGWTTLAALAEATSTINIGLLVTANPFRNPGVVAKMATTVDTISDGRGILGMGAAWNAVEHRAHGLEFGSSPGERLGWLEESIVAIRALLAGETYTSPADGRYALREAIHAPRPVRGRIPLLVGGGGERRTLRIVAEHADLWNVMGRATDVRRKAAVLDEHCRAVGRPPGEIVRTVTIRVLVRDRAADAVGRWQELMVRNGAAGIDLEVCAGTPAEVAGYIRSYVEAGFNSIFVELPAPYDAETIERLPADVLPLVY